MKFFKSGDRFVLIPLQFAAIRFGRRTGGKIRAGQMPLKLDFIGDGDTDLVEFDLTTATACNVDKNVMTLKAYYFAEEKDALAAGTPPPVGEMETHALVVGQVFSGNSTRTRIPLETANFTSSGPGYF